MTDDPAVDVAVPHADEPLLAQSMEASLTVADVRRSADWYRDVLGFTVAREFERGGKLFAVSLRAGAIRLLVTQDDGGKGADRPKGEGFSLQITTQQNIDALAGRAKRAGAALDSEPADARGARVFRLRDPDGFRLVVSSPREAY
jgi:catechol 2,3-dioxygenase-like lactoylglutathione lyase family enzyme